MTAKELFSREEIRELTQTSNLRGGLAVATTWAIILGSLAMAASYPSVVTVALAIVLLGGRHLALAILMHEASHRSLMRSRRLNDWVGHWLCAAPTWLRLEEYRQHHMRHHAHTGTDSDPDLCLVAPFPTTPRSLARKLVRDITGLTGLRRVVGLLLMDAGVITYTASGGATRIVPAPPARKICVNLARRLWAPLVTNLALFALVASFAQAWVFLLWPASYLTTYSLFLRVRSMAEHACTNRGGDPLTNTRTTHANWLARLTVAPHGVNYHIEHHLLMTVPFYQLKQMHNLLKQRDHLSSSPVAPGYFAVLRQMRSR